MVRLLQRRSVATSSTLRKRGNAFHGPFLCSQLVLIRNKKSHSSSQAAPPFDWVSVSQNRVAIKALKPQWPIQLIKQLVKPRRNIITIVRRGQPRFLAARFADLNLRWAIGLPFFLLQTSGEGTGRIRCLFRSLVLAAVGLH